MKQNNFARIISIVIWLIVVSVIHFWKIILPSTAPSSMATIVILAITLTSVSALEYKLHGSTPKRFINVIATNTLIMITLVVLLLDLLSFLPGMWSYLATLATVFIIYAIYSNID